MLTGAFRLLLAFTAHVATVVLQTLACPVMEPDSLSPARPPAPHSERALLYLEGLLEAGGQAPDAENLLDRLEHFRQRPLNLNTATPGQLQELFLLNDLQIVNLLTHIREHGRLISLPELQAIDGFDLPLIESILPYVSLGHGNLAGESIPRAGPMGGNQLMLLRYQRLLEEQKGFRPLCPFELESNPNARYLGSPYRLYARYRYTRYDRFSLGITAEKDPGEEFFRGSQPRGFDFYSGHLQLKGQGILRNLTAGDFQLQSGQGLTLWTGMGFGKTSQALNVKKNGTGIRPHTAVDENNFFRGIAATAGMGSMEVTVFFSSKRRDAALRETDTRKPGQGVITSLQQSGLHRTPSELAGKNSVRQTVAGGMLHYRRGGFKLGATAYHLAFSKPFGRNLSFHNQFAFGNQSHHAVGMHYSYGAENMVFFGEVTADASRHPALLKGVIISLDPGLSLALLYRNYHKKHQSPLASAFGENPGAGNEMGMYAGMEVRVTQQITLSAFADHIGFPWMRYRSYMPSEASDYLIHLSWAPGRDTEISLRYRKRSRPLNSAVPGCVHYPEPAQTGQLRIHGAYPVLPGVSMRTRAEMVRYAHGANREKGFLIYHDILYRNSSNPLSATLRYAMFDTGGHNSRIYAHEHDVLYAFSFPFYSDAGTRAYLLVRYRLRYNLDLYARIAQTAYRNRDHSGSGLDRVEGNLRTELKLQLRFRF